MLPGRVIAFSSNGEQTGPTETARLSVVQVSRDQELSRLRSRILIAAGHSVRSLTPEESLAECKASSENRIWVFCHTIEFHELVLVAVSIRRMRPDAKLVRMTGLDDDCQASSLFDESLDPITGVDGLLRAVAHLSAHP